MQLENCCRLIYCKAVTLEVSMLQQREKLAWLKGGNNCSKIFFRKINARRASLRVYQIQNEDGNLLTDHSAVIREFTEFCKKLFGGSRSLARMGLTYLQPYAKHIISTTEAQQLISPVQRQEIKDALFGISEDSALGPDGFSSGFFKAAWTVISDDFCQAVLEFFSHGHILKQLNTTLITSIPKVQMSVKVGDFRPIACCNVVYKVITKVMVKQMQLVLEKLIDNNQNAFVPGRSISNNILLAQELLSDDLLLFCKADLHSVTVLHGVLHEYQELSGLKANAHKSQVLLSKAVEQHQQILHLLGFQQGTLPVRYLGVPLITSKLSLADCAPLIQKIEAKIAG
ncbi:UNVERIFIED_CONTAM: hypothetical protein Slati_4420000 [Sesamum latifolium]|uniref:Reverse transcriptase domain-containing protein n=1 Tax=Sesamum latifolium TaxID=2727402 RepID=A0AAW2SQ39_9LAMI